MADDHDTSVDGSGLLAAIPDPVYVNVGDHIAYANLALGRLVGVETARLVGQPVFSLFVPDQHDQIRRRIALFASTAASRR